MTRAQFFTVDASHLLLKHSEHAKERFVTTMFQEFGRQYLRVDCMIDQKQVYLKV